MKWADNETGKPGKRINKNDLAHDLRKRINNSFVIYPGMSLIEANFDMRELLKEFGVFFNNEI